LPLAQVVLAGNERLDDMLTVSTAIPEATTAPPLARRIPMLDMLRGIAILLVVGRHLAVIPLWTKIGWSGLDLFFVLSGFLIAGLLFDEWQKFGSIDFKRFYIRRGLKIYPSFYALIVVSVLVNVFYPGIPSNPVTWRSAVAEALFVQNYFHGIWGQTWSLAVEEHFYIVLPVVLSILFRRSRNHSDPFRLVPGIFMVVATAEMLLRIATGWHLTQSSNEFRYVFPTHLRIDSLLFGVLLSYYRHFQPDKFEKLGRGASSLLLIIFAFVLMILIPLNNPIMHTVGFTVVYFGYGLLLVKVIDAQPRQNIFRFGVAPLAKIGYYSYSIYLWHGWVCRLIPHANLFGFSSGWRPRSRWAC
jgi:peptidoglycan/LPS O-acetylase OafA/YrhL